MIAPDSDKPTPNREVQYQYFTKKDPRPVRGSPGDGLLIVFVNY